MKLSSSVAQKVDFSLTSIPPCFNSTMTSLVISILFSGYVSQDYCLLQLDDIVLLQTASNAAYTITIKTHTLLVSIIRFVKFTNLLSQFAKQMIYTNPAVRIPSV
jgi:hypothetical protein